MALTGNAGVSVLICTLLVTAVGVDCVMAVLGVVVHEFCERAYMARIKFTKGSDELPQYVLCCDRVDRLFYDKF